MQLGQHQAAYQIVVPKVIERRGVLSESLSRLGSQN